MTNESLDRVPSGVDGLDAVLGGGLIPGRSYLADNVVFLRHLEPNGRLRKAIGVLKMRASDFGHTLRAFRITANGISVGDPLDGLTGILTGERRMTTPTEYDDE